MSIDLVTMAYPGDSFLEDLRRSACECLGIVNPLVSVLESFIGSVGKSLRDVGDELIYNSLLGGLRDDGSFSENAIANFIADLMGIRINDPREAAENLKYGIKPRSTIEYWSTSHKINAHILLTMLKDLAKPLNFITSKLGKCDGEFEIPRDPAGIVELFRGFLEKCCVGLLPQYNSHTYAVYHTAQLTNRYFNALKAQSEGVNEQLRNLLNDKKLLDELGFGEIKGLGLGDDWDILGYPDCLTYSSNRAVACIDMDNISTIGGAVNKAIVVIKAILKHYKEPLNKWFKIEGVEGLYDQHLTTTIKDIMQKMSDNDVKKLIMNMSHKSELTSGYSSFTVNSVMNITEFYENVVSFSLYHSVKKGDYYVVRSHGNTEVGYVFEWHTECKKCNFDTIYPQYYVYPVFNFINNVINFKIEGVKDSIFESLSTLSFGKVHVVRFLSGIEPLMFIRVLNPVFIDGKVLLTNSSLLELGDALGK